MTTNTTHRILSYEDVQTVGCDTKYRPKLRISLYTREEGPSYLQCTLTRTISEGGEYALGLGICLSGRMHKALD